LVEGNDPAVFEAAIDKTTKGIFVESITNPLLEVMDIPGLAEVAHRNGIPLIVDVSSSFGFERSTRARRRLATVLASLRLVLTCSITLEHLRLRWLPHSTP
jgi:O-acetylhomoserine/O-acetylserine sulfhydrylase-like pyridoxal-dependent enzyme